MAVTADNSTLIVADSYRRHLAAFDIDADGGLSGRRIWADLGEGVPDGICADASDAVWYADVPNQRCVRVSEGGEVLRTVELDRGGLRLRARRSKPDDAVHRGRPVAWDGRCGTGGPRQRPGARHRRGRTRRGLAVTDLLGISVV